MHGLNHAVVRQPTFSPSIGEKVFLCPPDAENGLQLRSRSLVSLRRITTTYASVAALPAALPREGARLGAPGVGGCEKDPFDRPQEVL